MKIMGLKIDVRTFRGTKEGVPALIEILKNYNANASFFWSLGKDQSGRSIRRIFRRGFFKKRAKLSVLEHYGLKTMLYGTLLPSPDIGKKCSHIMKDAQAAGFDMGIYAMNPVLWQDFAARQTPDWIKKEMARALDRFESIFGEAAKLHGAAGWQMNWEAYRQEQRRGIEYAADCRGHCPFIPVYRGQIVLVPQFPTTLPTLDELIGLDGHNPYSVHEHLLQLTETAPEHGHIYTLSAELEGQKLMPVLERLLKGWQEQGYQFQSIRQIVEQTDLAKLPHHEIEMSDIAGRPFQVAKQGALLF